MFTEILYVKIKKINQHKELINIKNKKNKAKYGKYNYIPDY